MSRYEENYRSVFISNYKIDDDYASELLDSLIDGICPICGERDEDNTAVNLGKVGETARWDCSSCEASIFIENESPQEEVGLL